MAAKEIKAGRAFLELTVKDSKFAAGLQSAITKMRNVGRSFTLIGAGISAAGAAITAPFLKSVAVFKDFGSQLHDMSQRTGVSVERLSELTFAAEQSGTSIEALEKIIGFMQKSLSGLAKTNEQTGKAFRTLGIDINRLRQLSPDEQLRTLLDAMGNLPDAATRSGIAMTLFGKSGRAILPLINQWKALSAEAKHFNLTVSTESAKRADALGDAFDLVKATFKALAFAVGDAFAKPLTRALRSMAELVSVSIKWARANKGLIVVVGSIGAAIAILGSAITGLGISLVVVSVALSGILAAISALLSPFALITGVVIGLGVAFLKFTNIGQAVVQFLGNKFAELAKVASETFAAIGDALAGGDILAAANVLWAGLRLAWLTGTSELTDAWIAFTNTALLAVTNFVFDVKNTWVNMWAALKLAQINFNAFFAKTTTNAVASAKLAWHSFIHFLAGINATPEQKKNADENHRRNVANIKNERIEQQRAIETGRKADEKFLKESRQAEINANKRAQDTAAADRKKITDKEIADAAAKRDAAQKAFDDARKRAGKARQKGFGDGLASPFNSSGIRGIAATGQGLNRSTFSGRLAPQIFGAGGDDVSKRQLVQLQKIARNTEKALKKEQGKGLIAGNR